MPGWRRAVAGLAPAAFALCLLASVGSQSPAPGGGVAPRASWYEQGNALLEREDPVGAWDAFRRSIGLTPERCESQVGIGRAHLMLGRSAFAQAYAEAANAAEPRNQAGLAL